MGDPQERDYLDAYLAHVKVRFYYNMFNILHELFELCIYKIKIDLTRETTIPTDIE